MRVDFEKSSVVSQLSEGELVAFSSDSTIITLARFHFLGEENVGKRISIAEKLIAEAYPDEPQLMPNIAYAIRSQFPNDCYVEILQAKEVSEELSENSLSIATTSHLIRSVSEIITSLHIDGLIHGAISPKTVLIEGKAKFDLVGSLLLPVLGPTLQSHLSDLATFDCASPEDLLGEDLTIQSDVFSFSAFCSHLLLEKPVFTDPDERQQFDESSFEEAVDFIRDRLAPLDEKVAAVLTRGMSLNPENRHPTINELSSTLLELLDKQATTSTAKLSQSALFPKDSARNEPEEIAVEEPEPSKEVSESSEPDEMDAFIESSFETISETIPEATAEEDSTQIASPKETEEAATSIDPPSSSTTLTKASKANIQEPNASEPKRGPTKQPALPLTWTRISILTLSLVATLLLLVLSRSQEDVKQQIVTAQETPEPVNISVETTDPIPPIPESNPVVEQEIAEAPTEVDDTISEIEKDALKTLLRSSDPHLLIQSIPQAVETKDPELIRIVLSLSSNASSVVRSTVIKSVSDPAGYPKSLQPLVVTTFLNSIDDEDFIVRGFTAKALGRLDTASAKGAIQNRAEKEEHPVVSRILDSLLNEKPAASDDTASAENGN